MTLLEEYTGVTVDNVQYLSSQKLCQERTVLLTVAKTLDWNVLEKVEEPRDDPPTGLTDLQESEVCPLKNKYSSLLRM